jgi:hypothetical protein
MYHYEQLCNRGGILMTAAQDLVTVHSSLLDQAV